MDKIPTPTPGFEFPTEAQDKVDQALRRVVAPNKMDVRSVRPDRMAQIEAQKGRQHKVVDLEAGVQAPATTTGYITAGIAPTTGNATSGPSSIGGFKFPDPENRPHPLGTGGKPPFRIPDETYDYAGNAQEQSVTFAAGVSEKPLTMIDNTVPPATPISTPHGISISLPSHFAYYDFKDLYVRPFRVPHLAKMSKADAQMSLQIVAETVSSVLETPQGDKNIAFKLCMTDLTAVIYWIRINSFTQKALTMPYVCESKEHIKAVQAGHKDESTLMGKVLVPQTEIVTKDLDARPDPEIYHLIIEDGEMRLRVDLVPERVQDAIEFLDLPNWDDPEIQFTAKIASLLDLERALPQVKWTLREKMRFVEEALNNDHVSIVHEFADLIDDFGIKQTYSFKCRECGASGQAYLPIDARTFLTVGK